MNFENYYREFANLAAKKSKDTTKVGAVLIGDSGEVCLTGYNGPPKGVNDYPHRFERPTKYAWICHAEANVIAFAARKGIRTEGCDLYVTHHPCNECMKLIIQSGIRCVYVGDGKTSMPDEIFQVSKIMASEAGIGIEHLQET